MTEKYLICRNGWYSYRKKVPQFVSHLDQRKEIKISLKTKSHTEALIKAKIYNEQVETYWKALIQSGNTINAAEKYRVTVALAKTLGFAYKSTDQIAASTLNEIVNRLSIDIAKKPYVEAVLGGVDEPQVLLSKCEDLYWKLVKDRLANKNEFQIRKWKNPRSLALNNFIAVVGDMPIHELTRSHVLKFREWWFDRISEGLNADGGNKQQRQVRDNLKSVAQHNEIDVDFDALFVKTRFALNSTSRPPFEANYVQNLLSSERLSGLNEKYRMIVYAMADTGAREVELLNLVKADINLDVETPYVFIRPRDKYELKTKTSRRKIPLVGSALFAFNQYPKGFGHTGNPDSFSSSVNKYFRENDLKPTKSHSLYSLRHTFKDRLRDIEAPEEMIDELMGHRKKGVQYGRGYTLEAKQKWLSKIAFEV